MLSDLHASGRAVPVQQPVRRYPRILFSAPLTFLHLTKSGLRTARGVGLDLSRGGLGALVQGQMNLGETVRIELQLRERPLNAIGIVRHSSSVRCGFEFLGLTPEEQQQIADVVGEC